MYFSTTALFALTPSVRPFPLIFSCVAQYEVVRTDDPPVPGRKAQTSSRVVIFPSGVLGRMRRERHAHPTSERKFPAVARSASWPADLEAIRPLFQEYRRWIAEHRDPDPASASRVEAGLGLIDRLTSDLPGGYGPPNGDILLWTEGQEVVACGALRALEPKIAEIRRIHVRGDYRGKEFGRPFVRALVRRARELGYDKLRSDTLPSMQAAIEFYQELGFRPIASFWPHPVAGALFFERDLRDGID